MTDGPKRPIEVIDEMRAQEIRQWLSKQERPFDVAFKLISDARIMSAVLYEVPQLCGLDQSQLNMLRQRARVAAHPKEVGIINELNKALADLTEGMAAAKRLVCQRAEVRVDDDGAVRGTHEPAPTRRLTPVIEGSSNAATAIG